MTVIQQDLITIKIVISQKRSGYHISEQDKINLQSALKRINDEAKEIIE